MQVREMQKLHPAEIGSEIEAIEASLIALAESETEAPPAALKDKLQQKIFAGSATAFPEQAHTGGGTAKVVAFNASPANGIARLAVAASVVLLIGSGILNFMLYTKLKDARSDLAELQSERSTLAGQVQVQRTAYEEKSHELAMVMKPGVKMIALKGMDLAPSASAMIVWNTADKSVYIDKAALPMPPQGKQYQLWALVNGKPVDAGVFRMEDGNFVMQKMKDMSNAQAFAVTLENMGGSSVPTMDAMYLMGNV